jgi:O-antigen/teichoic acid export membrane protein
VTLSRNLIAGLSSSIWSAIVGLAVVPFYLEYLGIEAYGLIGFFVTAQSLFQLLDMGMAPTINREVARCSAAGRIQDAGKLLHSLAVIYWGIALLIAILILSLAPLVSEYWIQSKRLSPDTISHAIILMGLVIACRWPIGLYQGALIGAQRLAISSIINMVMVTVGSVGAVCVLEFISPTIEGFFIWQAFLGLAYALIMKFAAWKIIGKNSRNHFDIKELQGAWYFAAGMTGISLTAAVLTQMDKIILSKMLSLEQFGVYTLASVVVSGLYVMVTPVFSVIFPRFSALVAANETHRLIDLYRLGTRSLMAVLFPVAMILIVFGEIIVQQWTGSLEMATSTAPIIAVLALGSALHGAMYFPYALQLAYGMTQIPLTINIGLVAVFIPLIVSFVFSYGLIGGAMAWLVLQIIYLLIGTWLTHRLILRGIGAVWLLHDIGIPLIITTLVGVCGFYIAHAIDISSVIKLVSGCMLAFIAATLSLVTCRKLRFMALASFNFFKN